MCKTTQCELRSLRVNSGMLNVIRIVTYYTLPGLQWRFRDKGLSACHLVRALSADAVVTVL